MIDYKDLLVSGIGLDDIYDMNEILLVKNENEYRSSVANKETK